MKKLDPPRILLILAAFLAPILGGQINTESTSLPGGLLSILRSTFFGVDTPTLSHAVVSALTALALLWVLWKRKVVQVPPTRVGTFMLAFATWITLTLLFTRFFAASLTALLEWLTFVLAFFATVAAVGRRTGPRAVVTALLLGCTVLALIGLREYRDVRDVDPTWRVFALWTPNSLAGIVGVGLILGLGLAMSSQGTLAALPWCCSLACGLCLILTQSRGGILSTSIGVLVLTFFGVAWMSTRQERITAAAKVAACVLLVFGFVKVIEYQTTHRQVALAEPSGYRLVQDAPEAAPAAPATPLSRMKTESGEQSSGFRILLWKGALQIIKENPLGTGIGTYRFYSAQPGLTTQTQLAHNTYLQLGVEAGILGFAWLPAVAILWLIEMLRGSFRKPSRNSFLRGAAAFLLALGGLWRLGNPKIAITGATGALLFWMFLELFRAPARLPTPQNSLRAALLGACALFLIDNMFESGLYSFGLGWVFAVLLGIGLAEATDGIAPEFIPKGLRWSGAVASAVVAIGMLHAGAIETLRAQARYARDKERDYTAALAGAQEAVSLNPWDAESWRLQATVTPSKFEHAADLKRAAELAPNTRNLRAYADALMADGDGPQALMYLTKALREDPNNVLTLSRIVEVHAKQGHAAEAVEAAKKLVAVEQTPYFQVRSLPDLIPVETYAARAFLAASTADMNERISELEAAVRGYNEYLRVTYPLVSQMAQAQGNPNAQFGGETLGLAQFKMGEAQKAALFLEQTYRELKRPADAARAAEQAKAFGAVAGNFAV